MPRLPLFYLSDTVLEVGKNTPLQKRISGTPITTGTVEAEIWTRGEGTPTKIGTTLTLTHQGNPDGYWSVNIDDDFGDVFGTLTLGLHVTVKLTVDAGAGFKLYMELDGIVEVDKGDTIP